MRYLTVFLLFLGTAAWADTQMIIDKDGSKATVLMLAMTTNPDAVQFYQNLTAPEQDMNGRQTKHFKFTDDQGVEAVDAVCAFSKQIVTTGSCVLTLNASKGLTLGSGQAEYRATGAEAARLAANFTADLRSTDGHLIIHHLPEDGFSIEYH